MHRYVIYGFLLLSILGTGLSTTPTTSARFQDHGFTAVPHPLLLPFTPGETWYICQGYNGQISHHGTYSLDLSIDPNSPGPTGCRTSTAHASTGKRVRAPGAGKVYQANGPDGIYIRFDAGGTMIIGHLTHKWPVASANTLLGTVAAGEDIGSVNAPGVGNNGGYAHLHIQLFPGTSMSTGQNIPFDDAHQSRFLCAPNLPDLGNSVTNQHRGTPLSSCNQAPHAPIPLAPANESTTTNPTITLSWHDGGDPDNSPQPFRTYFVEIWKTDFSWTTTSGTWLDTTSWSITVPEEGTYKWQVKARDGAADSIWSPAWHITYDCAPPICHDYAYAYVGQTGVLPLTAVAGAKRNVHIQIKNTGTAPWDSNTTLAPRPHDTPHPLYDADTWAFPGRIISTHSVQPGETTILAFALRAPTTPGTYMIEFDLVQEGLLWFPPPHETLAFELTVLPQHSVTTPLKRYWNGTRQDHISLATMESEQSALENNYTFVRHEGFIFPDQQPGTIPLKLYWHGTAENHMTAATPESESEAHARGYSMLRTEGYIYPTFQPGTIPLRLYWSQERHDYLTVASADGIAAAGAYTFVRIEGYVYPQHLQGLNLYYSDSQQDNFSLATPQGETDALGHGYVFARTEGYLFPTPQPGTVALKLYYNAERDDNMTLATAESEQSALENTYTFARVEGYLFPTPRPHTVPLLQFWSAARGDHMSVSTPAGIRSAYDNGYQFVRVEGYTFPAHPTSQMMLPMGVR